MSSSCPNSNNTTGSQILAQQMFLGASIVSFSSNLGWGGSSSTLNVELANDFGSFGDCYILNNLDLDIFNISTSFADNHYYDCAGDTCYVDETGKQYNPDISKTKIVPGKVYHKLGMDGLVSKYWTKHDPGFFGDATLLEPSQGNFIPRIVDNVIVPYRYNIIGVPVMFRYGYFTFGGIIQSWERTINNGPGTYNVNIVSADDLLNRCYVILDSYGGSIFKYYNGSYGGPSNYAGTTGTSFGSLSQGNIPNVFNVYGFLESFQYGFSEKNDKGIPIEYIIKALSVLTSSNNKDLKLKAPFSPFGRIIAPIPVTDAIDSKDSFYGKPTEAHFAPNNSFGLCDQSLDNFGISRCEFTLDLSELPIPPRDIRLDTSNTVISILDLIRQICDKTGRDFYTTIIRKNNQNIIKIKTANRTLPVASNTISSVIDQLISQNIRPTAASVGQEHNTATPKVFYIGANQQRLYQAKNYLLGYTQSSYIFNPITNKFIVLRDIGSAKIPSTYSTRNISLSKQIIGNNLTNIFTSEQTALANNPDAIDNLFRDNDICTGDSTSTIIGSYNPTIKYNDTSMYSSKRYIPLFKNSISPFFGYRFNEKIEIDTTGGNTYRFIRPVFYDIWTGQLAVSMTLEELPVLSIGRMPTAFTYQQKAGLPPDTGSGLKEADITPTSSNTTQPPDTSKIKTDPINGTSSPITSISVNRNNIGFIITESEIRAAMAGPENYLAYCLAKSKFTKPDLFTMLVYTYISLGKLIGPPTPKINLHTGNNLRGLDGSPASNQNVAGEAKNNSGKPISSYKQLSLDFNLFLNHEFIKDLTIISEFIARIGDEFYGKKYLIRLPEVQAYRDKQNPNFSIPIQGNNVSVYQGSGKIYFNYEPTDGAWEEYGNFIDATVAIGSPNYYKLIDSNNLIKPLLGYNASYNLDFVTKKYCEIATTAENKRRLEIPSGVPLTASSFISSIAGLGKLGRAPSCGNFFVPSLDISKLSDYLLTEVSGIPKDAFDDTMTGAIRQKLYINANLSNELAFLDPVNLVNPVAIMESPGIDLYSSSMSYVTDPNLTIISNAASEDFAFLGKAQNSQEYSSIFNKFTKEEIDTYKSIILNCIIPMDSQGYLISEGDTSNQAAKHYRLAYKKAHPIYAGVPLKSNIHCYGPWTNYPAMADQNILFPNIQDTKALIEQMISDIKIEKKDELNPWTYGGMSFLDQAVVYDILNYLSYQTRLEQGSLTIGSLPIFGLAGNLSIKVTDSDFHKLKNNNQFLGFNYTTLVSPIYNGLIISGLNINVSNSNISTSYSFRTYSPKLGLFSKENSDRIKEFRNSVSVFNRKIANTSKNLENSVRKQIGDILEKSKTGRQSTNISSYESKIYAASPTQLIIGKASYYIPLNSNVISQTGISNSWAGMFVPDEALAELSKQFNAKAAMSMDGLFSPVSLYPTNQNSTFAISSRTITSDLATRQITCPKCQGSCTINETKTGVDGQSSTVVYPCPLCTKSKVLVYDSDNLSQEDSSPPINFITLNPISLSNGEFRNLNAQAVDGGRNNIRVIGRSEIVPTGDKSNLDSSVHLNDPMGASIAFGEIDNSYKTLYNVNILNNHRFFAHRGPLMLHGWGYDLDGFPVPNEADEPMEKDSEGRPKRFFLTSSGTNDLTRDGAFLPSTTDKLGDIIGKGWEKQGGEWARKPSKKFYLNWGERPDLWPIGPIDLRWDYENKIWVGGGGGCNNADPPYIIASGNNSAILSKFISTSTQKSKKCSYKMIYGVLEQDLTKLDNHIESSPARAFLDDLEYGLKPLPENIRRLIYIVDRTGYTAPRGAKLLLRYNIDTGFYEPVSKQQYIVFGMINSNNSAVVEFSFMPGYKSGDPTYKSTINYTNPLGLKASASTNSNSRRGAFMYDNSRWNLIAIG